MAINDPQIIKSNRLLDFGTGFYLTSDFAQAKSWAVRTTDRREEGTPFISVFHITVSEFKKLDILTFETPSKEWLKYISANRTEKMIKDSYDIVTGPVANDQAVRTINNYLKGYFSEEIAIQLLLPQNLKDQYVFKTEKALSMLQFIEVKHI
jgi:hypothetical protein